MKTTDRLHNKGFYHLEEINLLLKEFAIKYFKCDDGKLKLELDEDKEEYYYNAISDYADMMLDSLSRMLDIAKTIEGTEKYNAQYYLRSKCNECFNRLAMVVGYEFGYTPSDKELDSALSLIEEDLIETAIWQEVLDEDEDAYKVYYIRDSNEPLDSESLTDFLKWEYIDDIAEYAGNEYECNHVYTRLTTKLKKFDNLLRGFLQDIIYEEDLAKYKGDVLNDMFQFTRIEEPIVSPTNHVNTISDFFHFKDEPRLHQVLSKHLKGKKGSAIANYLLALESLGIVSLINTTSAHLYSYLRSGFNMEGSDQGINKCLKDVSPYREKQIADILKTLKQELSL